MTTDIETVAAARNRWSNRLYSQHLAAENTCTGCLAEAYRVAAEMATWHKWEPRPLRLMLDGPLTFDEVARAYGDAEDENESAACAAMLVERACEKGWIEYAGGRFALTEKARRGVELFRTLTATAERWPMPAPERMIDPT